jgi:cytochrome c biogenesis protein CcdA
MKLHALHESVIPAGVTVLLGLCNPPRGGCGELAKLGLLYPLVWIPCCGIVFAGIAKQSRLLNKSFGIIDNML